MGIVGYNIQSRMYNQCKFLFCTECDLQHPFGEDPMLAPADNVAMKDRHDKGGETLWEVVMIN